MSGVPPEARAIVAQRARWRCERCGVPAPGGHWHHRRSRRVVDEHQHCACNGVWLCSTCHSAVHRHPADSRVTGFIVSTWSLEPTTIPVSTPWGVRYHDCHGGFRFFSGTEERSTP